MMEADAWVWPALALLGAYHGINPGMGWLFAVALGLQERSARGVGRSLLPIGLGHGLAIGVVVGVASLLQFVLPQAALKVGVAVVLFSLGLYYLIRQRHPRWGGMQVGFGDLVFWSFLMASAHGAGFMVLPVIFGASAGAAVSSAVTAAHAGHAVTGVDVPSSAAAVLVHTAAYLAVTGFVAWAVYAKLGLALLRKAWINLDLIWAIALLATGVFTLLV